jgi:hypothetical protein
MCGSGFGGRDFAAKKGFCAIESGETVYWVFRGEYDSGEDIDTIN